MVEVLLLVVEGGEQEDLEVGLQQFNGDNVWSDSGSSSNDDDGKSAYNSFEIMTMSKNGNDVVGRSKCRRWHH